MMNSFYMDYQKIIDKYYPADDELRHILLVHSRAVTARALEICNRHPELNLDRQFVTVQSLISVTAVWAQS